MVCRYSRMSLKVLYTAFDIVPSPKGASRHITYFTQALAAAGHQVTLFTVGLPDMPAQGSLSGARILRYLSPEDNFLRRAIGFGDAVWEHLRAEQGAYDLVHFRDIWSGMAALEARRCFGYTYCTLFEVNGLPSIELKYHYPALRSQPLTGNSGERRDCEGLDDSGVVGDSGELQDLPARLKAKEQALLSRADAVVCVSQVSAIYLHSLGVPLARIHVIPNGVDPACFRPPHGWGAVGRRSSRPRLVYTGTFAPWQGVTTLIEAMPAIRAAFPEAELHLIGPAKGHQLKGLLKLAAKFELGQPTVCFRGPLPAEQIPEQLSAATMCLAPLAYNDRNVVQGCCPIKVLEYAAVGRPIVASNLPVVRELLGEGEALFFQPGDPVDLARQVIYLLSHPETAHSIGERAARRVCGYFTWERAGRQLLEVYAGLTTRRRLHLPDGLTDQSAGILPTAPPTPART
jgi:glycosyltransferase involved in cell wall biosynthesis